jgi:tetratricopeptide (TPR) repeat protein
MLNQQNKFFSTVIFTLALFCDTSAIGQNGYPSDFIRESRQADQFIKEKHWDAAKRILLRLVATPYALEHQYTELAFCYISSFPSKEDWILIEGYARKAISLDPEAGHAYTALASAAIEKNDCEGCIRLATKAMSCKQPDQYALYQRARAYAQLHRYNEALADLEKWDSIVTRSDKTQATVEMQGQILEKMGRIDDAAKRYRLEMSFHPEQAIKNEVRCLLKEKKYSEAVSEVSTLIKRNSDDSDAYNLRGSIKAQAKDWKGAIADYGFAIDLSPTSTYYENRARAYEALGQTNLAKQDLANAQKSPY